MATPADRYAPTADHGSADDALRQGCAERPASYPWSDAPDAADAGHDAGYDADEHGLNGNANDAYAEPDGRPSGQQARAVSVIVTHKHIV